MSVKIVDYKARISMEGKPFFALVLQDGIESLSILFRIIVKPCKVFSGRVTCGIIPAMLTTL